MTARFVIDASVAVKWVIPEPGAEAAHRLRDAYATGRVELLSPSIYAAEVSNVIWKKCRLYREIGEDDAIGALRLLLAGLPELVPVAALAGQALRLALTHRRPVYDCLYIALALQEACPCVTADGALIRDLAPVLGMVVSPAEAARML